jgi:phosphohistidine phosphatase
MKIYLVRHAVAVDREEHALNDETRPLTAEGAEKMKKAAAGLIRIGAVADIILSSPLVRARQTADILAEALGGKVPVQIAPGLAPGGPRDQVFEEIRSRKQHGALMLVGHQPSLGELAGAIAWGSSDRYVELKKGGVCAIELETLTPQPRGELLYLLTPAIMRSLSR